MILGRGAGLGLGLVNKNYEPEDKLPHSTMCMSSISNARGNRTFNRVNLKCRPYTALGTALALQFNYLKIDKSPTLSCPAPHLEICQIFHNWDKDILMNPTLSL